ncbi:MAG: adenine phosphoribosyltransferase [Chitinispirillaceae bacterium]|jgi:adenine phosphoribosyltransferase|nr:adenine phosphoribosyltransferase [Chitinispirillaceae bacterium]
MNLDAAIRRVPDFPKPGILFYDVTSIFTNPEVFRHVIDRMKELYAGSEIDGVIAIESRGFLIGSCFALEQKLPLVLARKKGKLPGKTIEESYSLEYGSATLQIHIADLPKGKRWLIVDDLIATGGTLDAVAKMVERQGSAVAGIFGVIGLPFLKYAGKIGKYSPKTLIDYHGE